jgi:hypothetical protein
MKALEESMDRVANHGMHAPQAQNAGVRHVAQDEAGRFSRAAQAKDGAQASASPEADTSNKTETLEDMLAKASRDLRQSMSRQMQDTAKDIARDYENS